MKGSFIKRITGIFILLLLLAGLNSCVKLRRQYYELNLDCPTCAPILSDTLVNRFAGVHYALWDTTNNKLLLKYDSAEAKLDEVYSYLRTEGFITKPEDSMRVYPRCCIDY